MTRHILVLGLASMLAAPALAQAPPQSKPRVTPTIEHGNPDACAQAQATVGQGGDIDVKKPQGKSLSEKLARSNGVICPPPHVDLDMKQPAPPGGSMPVIPPAGTPGAGAKNPESRSSF
jgi:hypothetical protein